MNHIIIRSANERTESKCIKLAKKQGVVDVVRSEPFGQAILESFIIAIEKNCKYTTVIDADVLPYDNVIGHAIESLEEKEQEGKNIFCLDGKTDDKILQMTRRAGIHIYKTELIPQAMNFIDYNALKPESNVREKMADMGYITWSGGSIIFGQHDYEQYYCDLWRKSICQYYKLQGIIEKTKIIDKWEKLSEKDNDFKVILAAHNFAKQYINKNQITIDKNNDYNANENIEFLCLEEKKEMRLDK